MNEGEEKTPGGTLRAVPGTGNPTTAPMAVNRCINQDHASRRVMAQIERQRDRLQTKQIYPVFTTVLYAFNCDKHGDGSAHVDLITTPLADLKPDGLDQVIASTEAMLGFLKALKEKQVTVKEP